MDDNAKEIQDDSSTDNCDGLLGYETPIRGDGLNAQYYNTPNFKGLAVEQTDSYIDFDWGSEPPVNGVNPQQFSVRWSGFLKTPVECDYTFRLKLALGARLTVDG